MFIAAGLDMSSEPCPLVVMDKTGTILECRDEERPVDCIVSSLESLACSSGKLVFCALSQQDAYEFESHYRRRLRERGVFLKIYDHCFLVRMEYFMRDLNEAVPLRAYCLARIVQSEGLDLLSYRDDIKKLYDMRETLDRLLVHLATLHALPDDYHLAERW
jgi:hypothetical protein